MTVHAVCPRCHRDDLATVEVDGQELCLGCAQVACQECGNDIATVDVGGKRLLCLDCAEAEPT